MLLFLNKDDFSLSRFLKMIWRINFFVVFLPLPTGTKWIALRRGLAYRSFVLCFVSFGFSQCCEMRTWLYPENSVRISILPDRSNCDMGVRAIPRHDQTLYCYTV